MGQHEDKEIIGTSEVVLKLEDGSNNGIYKAIYITFGILLCLTIISTFTPTLPHTSATVELSDTESATASVNVNAACTLSTTGEDSHTTTLSGGQYNGNVGTTTVKSICNDSGGYALYAIGYSNHSYIPTELGSNTDLIWDSSTAGSTSNNIATGTATSGNNSAWSMKLTATGTTNVPTIVSGNNYTVIPSTYTKVAYYPNSTMNPSDPSTYDDGSYLSTTYGIYVSPTQAPGAYTGAVKYTLVHPSTEQANLNLYDTVARMSKGKQNAEDLRKEIVTPTQETPVSTNSGVYEYNADEFGVASDANNNYPIYYYRGVLDTYEGLGTYGSDGMADAYPNYVKLGNNTCWRIVRTTGSGGIKMIYNGLYGATESGSCGNNGDNARSGASRFNYAIDAQGDDYYGTLGFAVYVGYNYNSDYAYNHTENIAPIDKSMLFTNDTASRVKTQTEGWYNRRMISYTDTLERSAGYCNDRTTYKVNHNVMNDVVPYSISLSSNSISYGANVRSVGDKLPSLECPNVTGRDILSVGDGLSVPVALLTADESAFMGHGAGGGWTAAYNGNSYINSGMTTWLLSPALRRANGEVHNYTICPNGGLCYNMVSGYYGVRPVVSLVHDTAIVGGSGTATDPWVIDE